MDLFIYYLSQYSNHFHLSYYVDNFFNSMKNQFLNGNINNLISLKVIHLFMENELQIKGKRRRKRGKKNKTSAQIK